MAGGGNLWKGKVQIGKEAVPGTSVAATRILYSQNPTLTRTRKSNPKTFMTGTRDNVRAHRLGPVEAGGTLMMDMDSAEILELLLLGVKGGVTPTTPSGGTTSKLWTFVPSGAGTLDSATIEWFDGANAWQGKGMRVDELKIAGSVTGDNTVTGTLFGTDVVTLGSLTGSLTERTPDYFEGWETKLYIDDFGSTPGTTNIAGTLIDWSIDLKNNLARKYTADNTLSANSVNSGTIDITAQFKFEAVAADAVTEFTNWDGQVDRVVRLEFGQNKVLEAALKSFVTIDIPGAWSTVDLTQSDAGTRVFQFGLQYVYEPTVIAGGLQIQCQNLRTTAY